MTLSNENNKQPYTGTGAVSTYSFPFPVFDETHIVVVEQIIATGAETTYTNPTDYTVTLNADKTGSITLVAGNLPATKKVVIKRIVPLTQLTDIRNKGAFFPEIHEDEFDLQTMADQQIEEQLDRSVKVAQSTDTDAFSADIGVPTADYFLKINGTATGFDQVSVVDSSNLSLPAGLAFMVQTSANAFTARTITSGAGITITNGDGQSGNPVIALSSTTTADIDTLKKVGQEFIYWAATGVPSEDEGVVVYQETQVFNRDGTAFYEFQGDVSLDLTTTGAGGLDQGTLAVSSWYALVAIFDSNGVNNPSAMCVLDSNYTGSIVLPSGYDEYRRIGYILTDGSGGINVDDVVSLSDGTGKVRTWLAENNSFGSAAAMATYDLSGFIAPSSQVFELLISDGGAALSNLLWEPIEGSGGSTPRIVTGMYQAGNKCGTATMPTDDTRSIRLASDNGAINLYVNSYVDDLARRR